MSYRISGSKSETARIVVLKENDWSIESNTIVSGTGAYEIDSLASGTKTVIAVKDDGDFLGYGNVPAVADYDTEANSMCKNINTACAAYYVDWNEYALSLAVMKSGGYLPSYEMPDTGEFNYYVSGDQEFAAWWEGGTRRVANVVGRYSLEVEGGNPVFRKDEELTTWSGTFPE
jgi:hypothetical protein